MLAEDLRIIQLIHPDFLRNSSQWKKYRLVYEGGVNFLRSYLQKFSKREDEKDFHLRKTISYSPSFAKAAVNDVRNAIAQRFPDIIREGGTKSYTDALAGRDGGINLTGMSMNTFLSTKILPELLSMGRVGIFIDMPNQIPITLADTQITRPYLYPYVTEQIRSWSYDERRPDRLLSVLLEDVNFVQDPQTRLTVGTNIFYRHMWLVEGDGVYYQFYDLKGEIQTPEPIRLELDEIPFVITQLSDSLLLDIADYQIALLNLESSDLMYVLRSNFAFYVEQFDPRTESPYLRQSGHDQGTITNDYMTQIIAQQQTEEIELGVGSGRRYPLGTAQPAFINPSSEPLRASMDKAAQMKKDIKTLINLNIGNLQSDKIDKGDYDSPIEAGLAIIGSTLETADRRVGQIWSQYERSKSIPLIIYPGTYNLRSEEDRRTEAKELTDMIPKIPSKTYQKELAKQIAVITVGHKVSSETLTKIKREIDASEVIISDPDIIKIDLEGGLVGIDLASRIRGYPEGQVEAAKRDHADRIERINAAQTLGAGKTPPSNGDLKNPESRGVPDLGANKKSSKEEKAASRDKTMDDVPKDHIRGEEV